MPQSPLCDLTVEPQSRTLSSESHDSPDLVVLADFGTGEILDVGRHGVAVLGWTVDDLVGTNIAEFGQRDELHPELFEDLANGRTVYFDAGLAGADGSRRPYNVAARCPENRPNDVLLVARELGALAHSRSELAKLMMLADLTDDVFLVCDREGYITYANAACRDVHQADVPLGRHMTEFLAADDSGYRQLLEAYKRPDGRAEARVTCVAANGSTFVLGVRTVYDHSSELWYTVERDITSELAREKELRRLADDMRHQATTDALTGVANRYALNACLEEAIERDEPRYGRLQVGQ
jgi:PAS domain-containing protein